MNLSLGRFWFKTFSILWNWYRNSLNACNKSSDSFIYMNIMIPLFGYWTDGRKSCFDIAIIWKGKVSLWEAVGGTKNMCDAPGV